LKIILGLLITILFSMTAIAEAPLCINVFNDTWVPTNRIEKNNFVTNRSLWEYTHVLDSSFKTRLDSLGENNHWIDLGAGKANAQVEFLKSKKDLNKAPLTTAFCFKLDRLFAPRSYDGKLKIQQGMFESINTENMPKADIITDVFGVLSYSKDMKTSLQKTFALLKLGGELYIHTNNYSTKFQDGSQTFTMIEFLGRIEGIKIEGKWGNIKITKIKEEIFIPDLTLTYFKDEAPPYRGFTIDSAPY
jgi:hypothetical protein